MSCQLIIVFKLLQLPCEYSSRIVHKRLVLLVRVPSNAEPYFPSFFLPLSLMNVINGYVIYCMFTVSNTLGYFRWMFHFLTDFNTKHSRCIIVYNSTVPCTTCLIYMYPFRYALTHFCPSHVDTLTHTIQQHDSKTGATSTPIEYHQTQYLQYVAYTLS